MNIALRKPMTLRQFLAWEERKELRYEFDGFQPVAMTGGTIGHDRITFNLRKALEVRLASGPCQPHGPNVKIIADGKVRYSDVIVARAPVSAKATVVDNPVVVFEVLSDGTVNTDLIDKNLEYRATPSVHRYVIVQQTHAAAIVFARQGDMWPSEIVAGDGAHLSMPEIGIDVPLAELYAGIELIWQNGRTDRLIQASDEQIDSVHPDRNAVVSFLPAFGIKPGGEGIDPSALPPRDAGAGRYPQLAFVAAEKVVDTGLRPHDGDSGPCVNV